MYYFYNPQKINYIKKFIGMRRENAGHIDTGRRLEPCNELMNGPRVPSVLLLQ